MAVKDMATTALTRSKDFTQSRWQAFREESPYFQAKVAMVAAWLAISVATVILAPPSPIPFIVEQKAINFGLSTKTTLIILNQDGGDLDAAVVEVSGVTTDFDGKASRGVWASKPIALPEGLKTTLSTESFFDQKGLNPGYQLRVDNVRILDDGDEVYVGPPTAPLGPASGRR
jgi:hypothetical protein